MHLSQSVLIVFVIGHHLKRTLAIETMLFTFVLILGSGWLLRFIALGLLHCLFQFFCHLLRFFFLNLFLCFSLSLLQENHLILFLLVTHKSFLEQFLLRFVLKGNFFARLLRYNFDAFYTFKHLLVLNNFVLGWCQTFFLFYDDDIVCNWINFSRWLFILTFCFTDLLSLSEFFLLFLVVIKDTTRLRALTDFGFKIFFSLDQIFSKLALFVQTLGFFGELHQVSFDLLLFSLAQFVINLRIGATRYACIQFSAIRCSCNLRKDIHDGLRSFIVSIHLLHLLLLIVFRLFNELSTLPNIDWESLKWCTQSMLCQFAFKSRVEVCLVIGTFQERLHHFKSVHFLVNQALRLLWRKLVLVNRLEHLMDACGSLLLRVVDGVTFLNPMQTAHDSRLDQTHRSIHVVILYSWDQNLFALL